MPRMGKYVAHDCSTTTPALNNPNARSENRVASRRSCANAFTTRTPDSAALMDADSPALK